MIEQYKTSIDFLKAQKTLLIKSFQNNSNNFKCMQEATQSIYDIDEKNKFILWINQKRKYKW